VKAKGFTLIEVMVALAVVAVALPALLMSLYQQMDNTAYLRDKSLAHMVAANKMTETRIFAGATRSIKAGKDSGLTEFADQEWHWWLETKTTVIDNFFRIEIAVAKDESQQDNPLYSLIGFISGELAFDQQPAGNGGNGANGGGGGNGGDGGGDGAAGSGTPPFNESQLQDFINQ
jgi:general secretion pathway protein I